MTPPNFDAISDELKNRAQWVLWRLETRNGKTTKVPYQADGCKASVDKPDTWTDYETAKTAYLTGRIKFSGVGFVLTANDPIIGVDLDKCLNPETGELDPLAAEIVKQLPTYCEVSPSGQGLRLFALGSLPPGGRRKGFVEMYEKGRYLTVTGNRFNDIPTIGDCTQELAAVHALVFGKPNASTPPAPPLNSPAAPACLTDQQILEKASTSRHGAEFARLWVGDTAAYGDDDSRADHALCNHLASWTGKDPAQMDRLFRQSGLFRAKWDEKRGEAGTYGQITINKAITGTRDNYSPQSKPPPDSVKNSRNSRNSRNKGIISNENQNDNCSGLAGTDDFEPGTTGTKPGTDDGMQPYFFMLKADNSLVSRKPGLAKAQATKGTGLYYVPVVQEQQEKVKVSKYGSPVWISIPFDLLATTDDGQGHGHGVAMRFVSIHGHIHTWTLPRSLLVIEGRELFQKLYDMGFHMALTDGSFQKLRSYLNQARAELPDMPKALSVSRTGWAPGNRFVLPDKVFGTNGVELFFQSDDPSPSPYTQAGTLEGWRESVAQPLADYDIPVFSIACAFAGPLLEPLRIESGGFHFEGLSSTGKTSAQRFALSAWGNPWKLLQSWNGTRVGVELMTAAYSDTLLVLDEIGQADPKAIGEIVYLICNENGRTRGNVRLTHRANLRWRSLLLSSGEKSLAQVMTGNGGFPPAAGQETRLAHLPVDIDGAGIFTGLMDSTARRQKLTQITAAARKHHGHAARTFLNRLTTGGMPDPDEAAALVKSMAAKLTGPDSTNEIDRVALRFTLVGYAGELATRWGITGWPENRAIEASTALFKRWRARWGSASRDETLFLMHLDEWLSEYQTGAFMELDAKLMREPGKLALLKPFYGFTTLSDEGLRTFYLNAAGWADLTRQAGRGVALNALKRTNRLAAGGDGNGGKRIRIRGESTRYYVIHSNDV